MTTLNHLAQQRSTNTTRVVAQDCVTALINESVLCIPSPTDSTASATILGSDFLDLGGRQIKRWPGDRVWVETSPNPHPTPHTGPRPHSLSSPTLNHHFTMFETEISLTFVQIDKVLPLNPLPCEYVVASFNRVEALTEVVSHGHLLHTQLTVVQTLPCLLHLCRV